MTAFGWTDRTGATLPTDAVIPNAYITDVCETIAF